MVFVCEHGAAKSVIAAAYFNKMATEQGLAYRAITRGTAPDEGFSAGTVAGLKKDGLPEPMGKPTRVSASDVSGAARVVTFGVKLPEGLPGDAARLAWNETPSTANYGAARDAIRTLVQQLVGELSHTH